MKATVIAFTILLGMVLLQDLTDAQNAVETCPGSPAYPNPAPPECDKEDEHKCIADSDCAVKEKCCPTYCEMRCTKPGPKKPGRCPVNPKPCTRNRKHRCHFDTDCGVKEKCCAYHCELKCIKV